MFFRAAPVFARCLHPLRHPLHEQLQSVPFLNPLSAGPKHGHRSDLAMSIGTGAAKREYTHYRLAARALCDHCGNDRPATGSLSVPAYRCTSYPAPSPVSIASLFSVVSGASDSGRHRSGLGTSLALVTCSVPKEMFPTNRMPLMALNSSRQDAAALPLVGPSVIAHVSSPSFQKTGCGRRKWRLRGFRQGDPSFSNASPYPRGSFQSPRKRRPPPTELVPVHARQRPRGAWVPGCPGASSRRI